MSDEEKRALNRQIAELLGWTELEEAESWVDERDIGYTSFFVWRGRYNGYERDVPDFFTDANATLGVCTERGWKLHFDPDGTEVRVPAERLRDECWYIGVDGATPQENAAYSLLAALQAAGT